MIHDLHYSYSDIMELPVPVYREVLDIYDRRRIRSETDRMHAELRRMLHR